MTRFGNPLFAVLFVADFFQPLHDLAVKRVLNGDVRQRGRRSGAMPVLLAGRKPNHIAGPYFFDRTANPLHPTSMATSVRVRDGKLLVTDGPSAETRELLGG